MNKDFGVTLSASNICGMSFHYVRYPLIDFLDHAAALELERVEIGEPHRIFTLEMNQSTEHGG